MVGVPQKPLVRLLMLLLLSIWGGVIYQVIDAVTRMDAPQGAQARPLVSAARVPYEYKADVPDPFTGMKLAPDSSTSRGRVRPKAAPPWMPPALQLTGILTYPRKATAVILGPDGSTHFLIRGDTLLGARILRIDRQSVAYTYNGKKAQWVLE